MLMPLSIIGAGLWGSVMAERIANVLKLPVTILERRPAGGGNCRSSVDPQSGIEFHNYGTHIFHTADQ